MRAFRFYFLNILLGIIILGIVSVVGIAIFCSVHKVSVEGSTIYTEEEIKQRKKTFDYLFFSALYETKDGEHFTPRFTPAQIKSMSERKVIDKKVMAMGGIDLEHIPFLRDNGFGGIVLLGAIWNRFQIHSTQDFREIISHFRKIRKATN